MRTYQIPEQNTDLQEAVREASSYAPKPVHSGTYEVYDPGTLADTIKWAEGREVLRDWIRSMRAPAAA